MFDLPQDQLDSPALRPPSGVIPIPSRTSPEQVWYFICVPLFTVIPGLFIMLRLYTKIKIVRKVDWTDWTILLSFLIFIVDLCLARFIVHHGAGVHQWNLRLGDYMRMLFWLNICEALYCPAVFLIKTAIVLQYLQILAPVRTGNEVMYYGGWGIIAAMFIFYTADIPLTLFICNPREKIWNDYYKGGSCMDYNALVVASASFNIVSDLFILLLPVRSVWKLRIQSNKKVAIIALFATGLLATLASSMRLLYMFKLEGQGGAQDISYEMAWMGLWSWAEIALGIIVACTFSFPKLVRSKSREFGFLFSSAMRPFTSLRSMFKSSISRTRSHEEITVEVPKTREYVHAPPGFSMPSGDGGSLVFHNSRENAFERIV